MQLTGGLPLLALKGSQTLHASISAPCYTRRKRSAAGGTESMLASPRRIFCAWTYKWYNLQKSIVNQVEPHSKRNSWERAAYRRDSSFA